MAGPRVRRPLFRQLETEARWQTLLMSEWDNVDAETRSIVSNDNFEGTAYVTVSEGQYLEISRASAEKVE